MSGPPSPEASLSAHDVRSRMQFLHPEKTLALWDLPDRPETDLALVAGIFGVDRSTYRSIRATFDAAARAAAAQLVEEPTVRDAVDALPFARGDVVVALGDSITDDYQSWAEILRELLALRRPGDGIRIVNHGVSGDTTADVIRRLWHTTAVGPTSIIALIGTNDARRDAASEEMLVSHEETARNLGVIRKWSRAVRIEHFVWMTPTPVLEERIAAFDRIARRGHIWRNTDVAEKANRVRGQPDLVVDVRAGFDTAGLRDLLLPDGLHPSLTGQFLIVKQLIAALART
jgi:lysophospholipase L1-like esterase